VARPGGPACAEACPTKGLTLVDDERLAELTAERARATIENEAYASGDRPNDCQISTEYSVAEKGRRVSWRSIK